jgi:hypothetical protein
MTSSEDQLSLLSRTIAAHAREVAAKEWQDEHKPILVAILQQANLGDLDNAMLTLQGKEVPIKVVLAALRDQFLAARIKALTQALADKVVATAMRTVGEEPDK